MFLPSSGAVKKFRLLITGQFNHEINHEFQVNFNYNLLDIRY